MTLRLTDEARRSVEELVRSTYQPFESEATDRFIRYFRDQFGESVRAVIFYGSCLSTVTRSPDSMLDFFVICDRYDRFYHGAKPGWSRRGPGIHVRLNRILAPNIYECTLDESEGQALRCKFCVVSERDLVHETSVMARDLYHLGRFSKRMAVVWTADQQALDGLIGCFVEAATTVAGLALGRLAETRSDAEPFSEGDYVRAVVALSYESEARVEASDKADRLFLAQEELYRRLYGQLILRGLRLHAGPGDRVGVPPCQEVETEPGAEAVHRLDLDSPTRGFLAQRTRRWLMRSRRRATQRWPKYVFMYDNWIDYMLEKLERTKGISLEISERDRRWPLIFGWKHFFAMRRQGLIGHRR